MRISEEKRRVDTFESDISRGIVQLGYVWRETGIEGVELFGADRNAEKGGGEEEQTASDKQGDGGLLDKSMVVNYGWTYHYQDSRMFFVCH